MIDMSPAMVEAVFKEYEADNPGRSAGDMTEKEFGERMMEKIYTAARILPEGNA
jgi:hypothetical protein